MKFRDAVICHGKMASRARLAAPWERIFDAKTLWSFRLSKADLCWLGNGGHQHKKRTCCLQNASQEARRSER